MPAPPDNKTDTRSRYADSARRKSRRAASARTRRRRTGSRKPNIAKASDDHRTIGSGGGAPTPAPTTKTMMGAIDPATDPNNRSTATERRSRPPASRSVGATAKRRTVKVIADSR